MADVTPEKKLNGPGGTGPERSIPKDMLDKMLADIKADCDKGIGSLSKTVDEIRQSHKEAHEQHDASHQRQHNDRILVDEKAEREMDRRFVLVDTALNRISDQIPAYATREYVDAKLDALSARIEQTATTLGKEREAVAKALGDQVIASAKALSDQVVATAKEANDRVGKIEARVIDIEKTGTNTAGSRQGTGDTLRWIIAALGAAVTILTLFTLFASR